MTILLVDIGNTCVKWALLDGSGLSQSEHFIRSKTGIKASLNKAWKPLENIEAVFVANVAGDKMAAQLNEWTEKSWQLIPQFISSEAKRFGVSNAYAQPEKLGVDRWLSLLAAYQDKSQASCIIDCGTAITIDIINHRGNHQGGMILPGLALMRSALSSGTEAIDDTTDSSDYQLLATNTYSAIQAGTLYSISATLQQIITDLQQSFKQIRFLLTGGDAQRLLAMLPESDLSHSPDLVLQGLALYACPDNTRSDKNKGRRRSRPRSKKTSGSQPKPAAESLPDAAN